LRPAKANKPASEEAPRQGQQCAMLQVKAKKTPAPFALERTLLSLTSPIVRMQPGTLVQVSLPGSAFILELPSLPSGWGGDRFTDAASKAGGGADGSRGFSLRNTIFIVWAPWWTSPDIWSP
jgi:hypothetical protein